jgi:hypothetical protein
VPEGVEIPVGVGDRLTHPVAVEPGQLGQDVGAGLGTKDP